MKQKIILTNKGIKMKIKKFFSIISIGLFLIGTNVYADYNLGYKYYKKYIKLDTGIRAPDFINLLNINSEDEIDDLFKNNGKLLFEKAKEMKDKYPSLEEGLKMIYKKHHLKDLKDFLKGIYEGKIPANC